MLLKRVKNVSVICGIGEIRTTYPVTEKGYIITLIATNHDQCDDYGLY
jgi:hypothetical protein